MIIKIKINYNYSIEYIKNIYKTINLNYVLQSIFISKIIIGLINNYLRDTDECDENQKRKLNTIEKNSKDIIKKNINILKDIKLEINENDIINKNIDAIYIDIIKSLIIKRQFENYEYTYKIINQLELENINITKIMYNELKGILDSKNNFIKDYIILIEKDLYDAKKIG